MRTGHVALFVSDCSSGFRLSRPMPWGKSLPLACRLCARRIMQQAASQRSTSASIPWAWEWPPARPPLPTIGHNKTPSFVFDAASDTARNPEVPCRIGMIGQRRRAVQQLRRQRRTLLLWCLAYRSQLKLPCLASMGVDVRRLWSATGREEFALMVSQVGGIAAGVSSYRSPRNFDSICEIHVRRLVTCGALSLAQSTRTGRHGLRVASG